MKSTRRMFLQQGGVAAATAMLAGFAPGTLRAMGAQNSASQTASPNGPPQSEPVNHPAAPSDPLAAMRAAGATTPIKVTKLRDTVFLLQGAGGNMVALVGPDGKLLIDSSFASAATRLEQALGTLDPHPLRLLVNTHWHFDHTDGNAAAHEAGAFIIAHAKTRQRLSTAQEIALMHLHLEPAPSAALPQQIFDEKETLFFNNEQIALAHVAPAHTDTDIYIHLQGQNVFHAGDLWFNGFYPFFDASSGGNIKGLTEGVDRCLAIVDDKTRIIPGHGPEGDKAALVRYREMLGTVSTRIEKLKTSGQSLAEVVASKPTADHDAAWGKGMIAPDVFATLIYTTLP